MTDGGAVATVTSAGKDVIWVRLDDGTPATALVRKKAIHAERLVPGDRVRLDAARSSGGGAAPYVVAERFERHTKMRRISRGREDVVAANLEHVVLVQALACPRIDETFVDAGLASAARDGLSVILVVTKIDLGDTGLREAVRKRYEHVVRRMCFVNGLTGEGISCFADAVRGRAAALVGPSGVGKSTLWNRCGGSGARVGSVSKRGFGRHTTTMAQALAIDGGLIFDLPGVARYVNDFDLDSVLNAFPDVERLAPNCWFRNCKHLHEPSCAVRAAALNGELDPDRYEAYRRLVTLVEQRG